MDILEKLYELRDEKYAEFQAKLTPNIDPKLFIGVRIPALRKLAKELYKNNEYADFINSLPHKYYDENQLHGLLLSEIKNYDECINRIEEFLPYVDNWAVCDIMSPKVFKRNKTELINKIRIWAKSDLTYTCRFGMEMLMSFYLDEDFEEEYLDIVSSVKSDEYYVNMMIAWFFATALAKQWDSSIKIIENKILDKWTHNKTIQKARESYRISENEKEYLKSLKQ